MKRKLHFYFDFISPYAYLAACKIEELAQRHDCELIWVPILLAAILNANGQKGPAEIPAKRVYTFKNILRLAAADGIPIEAPPAHPFNPLTALRIATADPGAIQPLFQAIWSGGPGPDALAGVVPEDLFARAQTVEVKGRLRQRTQHAIERQVFGVPSVAVDDEIFWGYDSFPHLEAYLEGRDSIEPARLEHWLNLPASASRI